MKLTKEQKNALKKYGVTTTYLFGSRAQGRAGAFSDFDFAVLMKDPRTVKKSTAESYENLYPIFSSIAKPKTLEEDVIDIVFLDSPRVPLELKSYVIREGKPIFDINPQYRADFESLIMLKTADFAPYRQRMREALLERETV